MSLRRSTPATPPATSSPYADSASEASDYGQPQAKPVSQNTANKSPSVKRSPSVFKTQRGSGSAQSSEPLVKASRKQKPDKVSLPSFFLYAHRRSQLTPRILGRIEELMHQYLYHRVKHLALRPSFPMTLKTNDSSSPQCKASLRATLSKKRRRSQGRHKRRERDARG